MTKSDSKEINSLVRPHRILHTMLRVKEMKQSEDFYTKLLGMNIVRKKEYPQGRFTLCFLGYGSESEHTVLELTYNWNENNYVNGDAFGHIALAVSDIYRTCLQLEKDGVIISRQPGPMKDDSSELIAFIQDPDGYQIELIEKPHR